jgi:hypothetical protein
MSYRVVVGTDRPDERERTRSNGEDPAHDAATPGAAGMAHVAHANVLGVQQSTAGNLS